VTKNAGKFHCCYVPWHCWRTRYTTAHMLHNITTWHGCIVCSMILYLFAIYNLALEDSSVFWIFVLMMLLKTNTLLIARKLLVHFLGRKTINNLFHRMFFWVVYKYDFFAKPKSWCMAKCLTEWWCWCPRQMKSLCCVVNKLRGSGVTDRGLTASLAG